MDNCQVNTQVVLDNSPLDCDGIVASTSCVAIPDPITFLNLPAESTQSEVNAALVVKLVQCFNTITSLKNRVSILENV